MLNTFRVKTGNILAIKMVQNYLKVKIYLS